jgi:alpha-glucosidase (family GH31 glycosyl hydrolase)
VGGLDVALRNVALRRVPARIICLCVATIAAAGIAALGSIHASGQGLNAVNTSDKLDVRTQAYELEVAHDGFSLSVKRGGNTVFQTATREDSAPNLSFVAGGDRQRLTKLSSFKNEDGLLTLQYETTAKDVIARVEIRPEAERIRLRTWLLNGDASIAPSLNFSLSPGAWYGGGFQGYQEPHYYPLNQAKLAARLFYAQGASQGTPIWYSTNGVAVWVRTPHDFTYSIGPRSVSDHTGMLSLEMNGVSELSYDLLIAPDVREVLRRINREIGFPKSVPPMEYLRLPVYTTWVESKTAVSQQSVLTFAKTIRENKLPAGVIEIDDKWEDGYGDLRFDAAKFPDPKLMNDELHKMGFRVTLWVHPFVNVGTHAFSDPATRTFLMKDLSGDVGLIQWWQGTGAVWDFTNPAAAAEFRRRLTELENNYGFDGFKFDGGDVNLVPVDQVPFERNTATAFPDIYDRETAAHFPWSEARVGAYSQPTGIVQRLIDKNSVWGTNNGLAAVLPEAILTSMRGYPYVMPDMVGGNQYYDDKIDAEMLVRWAQLSALMPLTQFSLGPWHFDPETTRLCRETSELREKFFPYIWKLAQQVPATGEPILRPVWYNFPADPAAAPIIDEFMLGNAVLVAPVIDKGAKHRDIYLPAGRWRDYATGETITGGKVLHDYPAPLNVLPIFIDASVNLDVK